MEMSMFQLVSRSFRCFAPDFIMSVTISFINITSWNVHRPLRMKLCGSGDFLTFPRASARGRQLQDVRGLLRMSCDDSEFSFHRVKPSICPVFWLITRKSTKLQPGNTTSLQSLIFNCSGWCKQPTSSLDRFLWELVCQVNYNKKNKINKNSLSRSHVRQCIMLCYLASHVFRSV